MKTRSRIVQNNQRSAMKLNKHDADYREKYRL